MRYFIFLLLLIISSCATKVHTLKVDKDVNLSSGSGYILFGIDTSQNLKSLLLNGEKKIRLTHENLKKGSNYLLVDIKAGIYYIDKIRMNNNWSTWFKDKKFWNIKIKPQQVNYVGHLEIKPTGNSAYSNSIELINRSSEALEFMEENYPNILNNRTMVYGGPGEDKFFELVKNEEETHD